jgi:hypothetical protein
LPLENKGLKWAKCSYKTTCRPKESEGRLPPNPIPYVEYNDYLIYMQNNHDKKYEFSRSKVKMITPNDLYTDISYKDFLAARNDIREKIREEKKQEAKPTGAKKQ